MGKVVVGLSMSLETGPVGLEPIQVVESPGVTHLTYRVVK